MKTTIVLTFLLTLASARTLNLGATQKARRGVHRTLARREVPQEHSHEKFLTLTGAALNLNNPDEIADPVFGLLGNAAGIKGAGKITDADCLQQATADQAFTNAKAAGDTNGMVAALVYRTLERNTGSVGLASVPCTSITAVNPEIAALSQHQDPASAGAAATNKAIALELAVQIASVGGDPKVALQSGTFAPGTIGDPTGAGNTCDTLDDPEGCIFTQNLLVEDATAAEIAAAVAAGSGAAAAVGKDAAAGNGTAVDGGAGAAAGNGTAAAGDGAAAGGGAAAGDAAAAADVEEVLSETDLDANTVLRLTKITKAAAAGAAAGKAAAAAGDAAAGNGAAAADGAAAGNGRKAKGRKNNNN